jgi:hypothetical protein
VYINIANFEKMVMPVILDIKTKSGKVTRVKLPVEVWQKNKEWTFKQNTDEEIESIVIDPDHVFPDINEANNSWTSATGIVEKDVNLNAYLGTFSNSKSPVKIVFAKRRGVINVEITGYPKFNVTLIAKDTFESKEAGLKFEFNEAKNGFDMVLPEGNKIPFKKE